MGNLLYKHKIKESSTYFRDEHQEKCHEFIGSIHVHFDYLYTVVKATGTKTKCRISHSIIFQLFLQKHVITTPSDASYNILNHINEGYVTAVILLKNRLFTMQLWLTVRWVQVAFYALVSLEFCLAMMVSNRVF